MLYGFKDLFQRGIQMSGSIFSEWAMNEKVIDHSKELAKQMGCDISTSNAIHNCIKEKSPEDINLAVEIMVISNI